MPAKRLVSPISALQVAKKLMIHSNFNVFSLEKTARSHVVIEYCYFENSGLMEIVSKSDYVFIDVLYSEFSNYDIHFKRLEINQRLGMAAIVAAPIKLINKNRVNIRLSRPLAIDTDPSPYDSQRDFLRGLNHSTDWK